MGESDYAIATAIQEIDRALNAFDIVNVATPGNELKLRPCSNSGAFFGELDYAIAVVNQEIARASSALDR